ncbi:deoxyribose-phosphate aldolase [Oscillospiraceae bacterium MB08-C2-2]|nr:deoxyribose-phosphate aldolase [Oscillospiraceae bacterium MB08-C2-2]
MSIASIIDHTILKQNATEQEVLRICEEALTYGFASVCVNPCWVPLVAKQLAGSAVKTCTVIGFPLGATTTLSKVNETVEAIKNGAGEVDMVINVGALVQGNLDYVRQDIARVVEAAAGRAGVKVIIETCLLTDEQKAAVSLLCVEAGADFVKTSTGFSTGGATEADIALIRKTVGDKAKIKASGGIRTLEDAQAMVAAGADRIGASAGVSFVKS